ncbi:MAG: YkoP family protein [Candidatus Limnocylindrales bacterium]
MDFDRAAPPRIMYPILETWERIDRRRRRVRPIRREGILGLELAAHRGDPVRLADGTLVRAGDLVGEMHVRNERIRDLDTRAGLARAFREARADLRALAVWARQQPPDRRLAAIHGVGITARLAGRMGWEVRPRRRTFWHRVEDWYFRWLLVYWSETGRARLDHGRGPLSGVDAWLSAAALERVYGAAAGAADRVVPPRGDAGQGSGGTSGKSPT